jgi:hypothetical protein
MRADFGFVASLGKYGTVEESPQVSQAGTELV